MALLSILSSEILTDSLNRGPFLTTARSPRLMSRDGEVGAGGQHVAACQLAAVRLKSRLLPLESVPADESLEPSVGSKR